MLFARLFVTSRTHGNTLTIDNRIYLDFFGCHIPTLGTYFLAFVCHNFSIVLRVVCVSHRQIYGHSFFLSRNLRSKPECRRAPSVSETNPASVL